MIACTTPTVSMTCRNSHCPIPISGSSSLSWLLVQASDRLIAAQQVVAPGTITVYLEPLFAGGFDGVPPGSSCIANAYTNNHDRLDDPEMGTGQWLFLHVIDTVGVVHAIILRLQALLLPVQTLVLSGGH